jgi:tryptophan synthase alpha chain
LDAVRQFRREDSTTPIVLMGYLNNAERMGYEAFAEAIAEAGVDGLIMVNLPPEEATSLRALLQARGIDLIFLSAPTTTQSRLDKIVAAASGFVYYVSLKGVTGADHLDPASIIEQVARIKQRTTLPVMVGFGIKTAEVARQVAALTDGIVVGSALVDVMGRHVDQPDEIPAALTAKVAEFRGAIDSAA